MMIKRGDSRVEPSRVITVREIEQPNIEVMTEFVAKGVEQGAEGRHFQLNRRSHPHPDHSLVDLIVSEELSYPRLIYPHRTSAENPDSRRGYVEERGCFRQKIPAGVLNRGPGSLCHGRFNTRARLLQAGVCRQVEPCDPVAAVVFGLPEDSAV